MKKKIIYIYNQYGIITLARRIIKALPIRFFGYLRNIKSIFLQKKIQKEFIKIFSTEVFDCIDIFWVSFGWEISLFQRPQQMALSLSKQKTLVFYQMHHKEIKKYSYPIHKLKNRLYLVDMNNKTVFNILLKNIERIDRKKLLHVYSTNSNYTYAWLATFIDKYQVVYEYIDDINITKDDYLRIRHKQIILDDRIKIVYTAKSLILDFKNRKNIRLIPNGVDFDHWNDKKKIIAKLENIKKLGFIVLGYYGAIAPDWFDYDLIRMLSDNSKYYILVIGPLDYTGPSGILPKEHISTFKAIKNVEFMDSIPYDELPSYSRYFDISIIPFLKNKITEGTSPVKLFEYMAMGKPIVTTYLPECLGYHTVLVSNTHPEFLFNINKVVKYINNDEFIKIQKKQSLKNTWEARAIRFKEFI